MGTLQKFVEFAEKLEGLKREDIDSVMQSIMQTYSQTTPLTAEQDAEDIRRAQDPDPQYANMENVERIFGRAFPS